MEQNEDRGCCTSYLWHLSFLGPLVFYTVSCLSRLVDPLNYWLLHSTPPTLFTGGHYGDLGHRNVWSYPSYENSITCDCNAINDCNMAATDFISMNHLLTALWYCNQSISIMKADVIYGMSWYLKFPDLLLTVNRFFLIHIATLYAHVPFEVIVEF